MPIKLPSMMDDSVNGMFLEKITEDEPNVIGGNSTAFYKDSFNLPVELQGGVGTISSRRPSYAAESFTRSNFPNVQLNSGAFNTQGAPYSSNSNLTSPFFGNPSTNNLSSGRASISSASASGTTGNGNSVTVGGGNTRSSSQSRSGSNASKTLSSFAVMNNFNKNINVDQFADSFGNNLSLNSNFVDFQARRPSQLAEYQAPTNFSAFGPPQQLLNLGPFQQPQQFGNQNFMMPGGFSMNSPYLAQGLQQPQLQTQAQNIGFQGPQGQPQAGQPPRKQLPPLQQAGQGVKQLPTSQKLALASQKLPQSQTKAPVNSLGLAQSQAHFAQAINLENGLVLKDQYIVASPELKELYLKTIKYFQNSDTTNDILARLQTLLQNQTIIKLITFIKNLNNLTFNHKILCLVINKNGKFDLLSYPNNSNICLQKDDLVVVDGDRGKDLVMIVEPLVNLNFAILFNFLKKLEHLKSLAIQDGNAHHSNHHQKASGTHPTSLNASSIINSHLNEDNEFIVTLPTKQVLRFATPKEIHKISGKFLEEKKAFITCYNKIKELNLEKDLTLINVEYQSDFKKLIFYYFAGFKRIDFRGLIKELFKIYKTRIWLCAVLPYDKPEMYLNPVADKTNKPAVSAALIPNEYELTNEQILSFSINEFENLALPNYFHQINLLNLIKHLSTEINGYFYGFNTTGVSGSQAKGDNAGKTDNASGARGKSKTSRPVGNVGPLSQANAAKGSPPASQGDRTKITPSFNPFGDS